MRIVASIGLLILASIPAKADRPATDAERARLVAAVAAVGCTGGKMEWDDDDRKFEVDDAMCSDGRKYDLEFDPQFQLIKKEISD